jgi:hypothetical protein
VLIKEVCSRHSGLHSMPMLSLHPHVQVPHVQTGRTAVAHVLRPRPHTHGVMYHSPPSRCTSPQRHVPPTLRAAISEAMRCAFSFTSLMSPTM